MISKISNDRAGASARAAHRRQAGIRCNAVLVPVRKEDVLERLLPKTRRYYDEFAHCPACNRLYWKGSHYERMQGFVGRLLADGEPAPAGETPERSGA